MAKSHYPRQLDLSPFLAHRSLFLLGPRQTGKSTLLRRRYPEARTIDLLDSAQFRSFSARPERLGEVVGNDELVIIDEVQKLPSLLDEVQRLIDADRARFILTGSSARKLKRGQANLLGGRALFFNLFPLTSVEAGWERIRHMLQVGGLPGVIDSPIAWEELKSYVGAYLREEIQAEALTRSIENFTRFLDVAAHFNAEQINYTKIGSDAEVPSRTIRDYVRILEDTLILHVLPAFRGLRRKTAATEKVYFFDVGVANALAMRQSVQPGTKEFGKALEQFVFLELKAALSYSRSDTPLTYWRTRTGIEVDFVIGDEIAIEVKGTGKVAKGDTKSLMALSDELTLRRKIVVCTETDRRVTQEGIEILPIEDFCRALWEGSLINS